MELFKWLDETNVDAVTNILQGWWAKGTIPANLNLAEVVSIFKKGDSNLLANYRPIALLKVTYKILAAIVKQRMETGIEAS